MTTGAPTPTRTLPRRRSLLAILAGAAASLALLAGPAPASAAVEWDAELYQAPTHLEPGDKGALRIVPKNVGDDAAAGFPTVSFDLPPGVTIASPPPSLQWSCTSASPPTVECTNSFGGFIGVDPFTYTGPGNLWDILVSVDVAPGTPDGTHTMPVTLASAEDSTTRDFEVVIDDDRLGFGPQPGSFEAGAFDQAGDDYTQAGGHPYEATTSFAWNTRYIEPEVGDVQSYRLAVQSVEPAKDVVVELPAGFMGDPSVGPKCPSLNAVETSTCPDASQVGVAVISPTVGLTGRERMSAIYNMEPPKNAPAQFAFSVPIAGNVILTPTLRSNGDWGLNVTVRNTSELDAVFQSAVTLWGTPADPSHDEQRCARPNFNAQACVGYDELGQVNTAPGAHEPHTSSAPQRPFLTNPTECTGEPVETRLHLSSWENPAPYLPNGEDPDLSDPDWKSATATSPPVTGCELLAFNPAITLRPTTGRADTPTGLEVEISIPQNDDPEGLATAHLRDTEVVLPEGMAVNPSSADGLASCSPREIGLVSKSPVRFDKSEPACPAASKIGTVEIDTPLLEEPLTGAVYVAEQEENPFDSIFALYIVVEGPGLIIKLAGEVSPDEETGQLTTTFLDNPQLPFETLRLRLKGGPRAPLATPPTCATYTTEVEMTPWSAPHSGPPAELRDSFTIDRGPNGGPCLAGDADQPGDPRDMASRPFDLGFTAGLRNPRAASRSPFTVRLSRPDGHQEIESLDVELPQGISASLRGVPLCSEADAANANCGPESQIGTVQAAAGAGSNPFWVTDGRVYLTGPYKGASLGLSVVVPAVAGPFDLGEVAVRAAAFVDKRDAHITVRSDPIPQILEGVPLRVRVMRIRIDRPDFTLGGTSCDESQVSAEANGVSGASSQLADRFQLSGCRGLGFKPKFRFKAIGKKSTPRLAHPRLRATVRPKPKAGANANISRARVTLPRGIELDQSNVARPCTRPQFADDACPNRTKMGRAIARSPLLDDPLRGPVYLVTSDNKLPDLVADLNGIVDIDLRGRIDTTRRTQRIRTTFDVVPDVPVRNFRLNLKGGRRQGLLINSTDRCDNRRQNRIKVGTKGHNGLRSTQRPLMRTKCGKRNKQRR